MTTTAEAESSRTLSPPFPGLRPFLSRDHEYFFGRDHQIHSLYRLLIRNHFIAVVGSSGSGKSSIVRAGLLPKLDQDNRQAPTRAWRSITMRPGRDPINRLANALAKAHSGERDAFLEARRDRISAMLRASSQGISEALEHALSEKEAQLVLVVDQFEELFRFLSVGPHQLNRAEISRRRSEAVQFVQLLLAAARNHAEQVRVIITMRSDFIGDCAWFQGLPEAVSAAQFLVPSLSKDQREEAIRKPIRKAGATIEPALVQRLLIDSEDELDQLPVLQHCLARLWMRASTAGASSGTSDSDAATSQPSPATPPIRHLTERDYRDIGGLAGALSGHADEILAALPGKERTVEQIFRALAEVDKESRAIRRPRELAQLIAETGAEREEIFEVLDKFRADDCSFIVPPLSQAPTAKLPDDTVIDVGHEALLRRWKRVSGDPEATGERGDTRDIGWLRQEQKDGERYQFLRSCFSPESSNDSRLSDDQVRRYWAWWSRWKPNPAWSERYGGNFVEVERLIRTSNAATRQSRWRRRLTYAAAFGLVALVGLVGLVLLEQRRLSEQTFKLAITSANGFSQGVLDAFNSGQISTSGAQELQKVATHIYPEKPGLRESPEIEALRTNWLLTDSDLDSALDNKKEARAQAEQAERNARKQLTRQPQNRQWQDLLYRSLFRLGDLDLEEGENEAAAARYSESEGIARQLNTNDAVMLASAEELAKRRFYLAFAINKVGEFLLMKKDFDGALAKFRESFEFAAANESATRMDQRVQSAATKAKIAAAMIRNPLGDSVEGLRNYTEAIKRYETVFKESPANNTNNIVRSNLAAAYQNRAAVYLKDREFEKAFNGYRDAASIFEQMVDDDPRNVRWLSLLAEARREFGAAQEQYAKSNNQPLDKATEQYRLEVAARERLVRKKPAEVAWRAALNASRERLERVGAAAAGASGKPAAAE